MSLWVQGFIRVSGLLVSGLVAGVTEFEKLRELQMSQV